MSIEQVQNLMARPESSESVVSFPAWDDEQLPPSESERITSGLQYTIETFFLPVTFEFQFDSNQRLVGRHIYD